MTRDLLLMATPMLDFETPALQDLIARRGWAQLRPADKIGAAYTYVKDEVLFGYNAADTLSASAVLADGYGQCNTKATLLMALLRGLGVRCRLHGFTIDKGLQRGVVPEAVYWLAPRSILHSWVEVDLDGTWINLEGFIIDAPVLSALQRAFPGRATLCAYGVGTNYLQTPNTDWTGADTYIQRTGINNDFGVFSSPDDFYAVHQQEFRGLQETLYRLIIRHWMNRRVAAMCVGHVPTIPNSNVNLDPQFPPHDANCKAPRVP